MKINVLVFYFGPTNCQLKLILQRSEMIDEVVLYCILYDLVTTIIIIVQYYPICMLPQLGCHLTKSSNYISEVS